MTTAETASYRHRAATRENIRTWSLAALIAFLANLVAFVGFTTAGGAWFTISDALGLALAAAMLPVMIGLDVLLRPVVGDASRTARWIGVAGMTIAIVGSLVLLTSEVSHEYVPAGGGLGMQFIGYGLQGVWFVVLSRLARRAGLFSRRLGSVTFLSGAGFLLGALGSPMGPESIGVLLGLGISFVAFIAWVVMMRRELATG